MVDVIIAWLLKMLLALALASFALTWLAGLVSVIMFGLHVYRRTESFDPFEWFAYLRSFRGGVAIPAELSHTQFWQRRIWRVGVSSIAVAALSGMSLAFLAVLRGH